MIDVHCSILRQVFHDLMVNSYGMQSKQLRNDVLIICLQIAQICPDAPFIVSSLHKLCARGFMSRRADYVQSFLIEWNN